MFAFAIAAAAKVKAHGYIAPLDELIGDGDLTRTLFISAEAV